MQHGYVLLEDGDCSLHVPHCNLCRREGESVEVSTHIQNMRSAIYCDSHTCIHSALGMHASHTHFAGNQSTVVIIIQLTPNFMNQFLCSVYTIPVLHVVSTHFSESLLVTFVLTFLLVWESVRVDDADNESLEQLQQLHGGVVYSRVLFSTGGVTSLKLEGPGKKCNMTYMYIDSDIDTCMQTCMKHVD